ncbi:MAG TPA: DUF4388 domain-containing protein [Chthoniobacterales bacterium]|nr:DUF4388 domain-containing protein [Chthoniobacterales bacterium]
MQLVVVHRDAELGGQLVQMVKDYTPHDCDLVASETAAMQWARDHSHCAFLLTQLDSMIDGLSLGASFSEMFPGVQTAFLPGYPRSEQRLELEETKVFPEPINGEMLLALIDRIANASPSAPDLFHVVDVLQMCCLSGLDGALQAVTANQSGIVYLRGGEIVHAERERVRGKPALLEIIGWRFVEFGYDRTICPSMETIACPWQTALVEAVAVSKEQSAASRLPQTLWAKLPSRAS